MSEIDIGIKVVKAALENPTIRRAAENAAIAGENLLKDAMPQAVVRAAEKAERIGADVLSSFDQAGYRHVPVRNLMTDIRTANGVVMRDTSGPSKIVFGEDNAVQHVLHNKNSTDVERADHLLTAGFAGLLKDDVLAKEAASKTIVQSAGFIPQPIERWASKAEAQQIAIDGSRAYVSRNAANTNKYTDYLTERFGPNTEDQQEWGRHIIITPSVPESGWSQTLAPPDSLLNSGVPIYEGPFSAQNKAAKGVVAHGWPVTRPGGVRLTPLEESNEAMVASLSQAGRIIPDIKIGDLDRATTEGLSHPVKMTGFRVDGADRKFSSEGRTAWKGLTASDLVGSVKAWGGKVQEALDPEKIRKAAQALESDLPFWGS